MKPVAEIHSIVFRSPSPENVFCFSPGILSLPGGRLVATMDLGGPGLEKLIPGNKGICHAKPVMGLVFISDDDGDTWRRVADFPFMHARPFLAGNSVYILGHSMDLKIIRSDDFGETWSGPYSLTQGEDWHQAPCNVWRRDGKVYLVMERQVPHHCIGWPVSVIAPVLMRGCEKSDLTKRESWTFASEIVFNQTVDLSASGYFGMPMYIVPPAHAADIGGGRKCSPWGWLETNVVQILDRQHIWYDPTGRTFHLFARAHTGHTNYACMLKVVEDANGAMTTQFQQAPSGANWLYLPWPGGQMKFHMMYDDQTQLYWLLSTQSTNSTIQPTCMPPDRYGLPDNERQRLQLHFSKNCVDWRFAAIVDQGDTQKQSRHYASMCIHKNNLCILSRSGDRHSLNAHNGNIISFHIIPDFRRLVY